MSNASVFSSIKSVSAAYREMIGEISDSEFQTTPPIGGWSYSEVYFHIFDASILSMAQLEACIKGRGKDKPTSLVAKLILFFGRFPPVKLKAPVQLEARLKKVTMQEAQDLIAAFLIRLEAAYPKISETDKNIKNLHPRLGYLDTEQWLRFIEIHLKHHYKQLKRIEKSF